MISPAAERLDTEEFNAICHNYRAWPVSDPAGVMARYNELLEHVAALLNPPPVQFGPMWHLMPKHD